MKRMLLMIYLIGLGAWVSAADRPNMVWIFSDDHSYQTIGADGGRLKGLNPTPNLDRIAKEGMRFDRCYVGNSICAPIRGTLLTGKHSHLHGKIDNMVPFNHDQPTLKTARLMATFCPRHS
jgi:arylsulfatase A-like enzyme